MRTWHTGAGAEQFSGADEALARTSGEGLPGRLPGLADRG
jgi:hypothetical protein